MKEAGIAAALSSRDFVHTSLPLFVIVTYNTSVFEIETFHNDSGFVFEIVQLEVKSAMIPLSPGAANAPRDRVELKARAEQV